MALDQDSSWLLRLASLTVAPEPLQIVNGLLKTFALCCALCELYAGLCKFGLYRCLIGELRLKCLNLGPSLSSLVSWSRSLSSG